MDTPQGIVNGSVRASVISCMQTTSCTDCSDVNTVQGVYPLQPPDGVGGHEGVGEVVATGPDAETLRVGDRVVPLTSGLGTWRTQGVYDEQAWHKVDTSIPIVDAATMTINPGTHLQRTVWCRISACARSRRARLCSDTA